MSTAAKDELVEKRREIIARRRDLKAELTKLARDVAAVDRVLWTQHIDQPVQPVEPARALAGPAGGTCGLLGTARDRDGRQHRGSRAPLGGWGKSGEHGQAIGRSRGGRTTKIHALCDGDGGLDALMLTGGQVHDIIGARALLARAAAMRQLIGDKAYDVDNMRDFLAAQGTEAVISPMPRRLMPPSFNPIAYRMRNLIERAFCKLKDWRGIAVKSLPNVTPFWSAPLRVDRMGDLN